jgi:hypothetical protein
MYITLGEAEKIVPVARSTFRKYAKQGKFSTSTNGRGLQIVQVAELERFFDGNLKSLPNENGNGNGQPETHNPSDIDHNGQSETAEKDQNGQVETPAHTQEIIELLKSQLQDTKAELTDAKDRETKLLSMLETEQEKTRLLMLAPPPDEPEPEKKPKPSIWGYFRLRR